MLGRARAGEGACWGGRVLGGGRALGRARVGGGGGALSIGGHAGGRVGCGGRVGRRGDELGRWCAGALPGPCGGPAGWHPVHDHPPHRRRTDLHVPSFPLRETRATSVRSGSFSEPSMSTSTLSAPSSSAPLLPKLRSRLLRFRSPPTPSASDLSGRAIPLSFSVSDVSLNDKRGISAECDVARGGGAGVDCARPKPAA